MNFTREGETEDVRVDNSELEGVHEKDDEEVEWIVQENEDEDVKVSLMLVGRLWTNRKANENALINTIKNVCQPRHGMEANSIGKNLFTFQFFHWKDKERIIEGQPWHFDRHALLLRGICDDEKPSELELFSLPVWARLYDLPFKGRSNEENVCLIAERIGKFIAIDKRGDMEFHKSLRIRVEIDVPKLLKPSVNIKLRGGVKKEVPVKYEKLPLFCFCCGRLGHGDKDCEEVKGDVSPIKKFGTWMKASPWRVLGKKEEEGLTKKETCAKRLFVPKPKRDQKESEGKVVQEMVHMLNGVVIGSGTVMKGW